MSEYSDGFLRESLVMQEMILGFVNQIGSKWTLGSITIEEYCMLKEMRK